MYVGNPRYIVKIFFRQRIDGLIEKVQAWEEIEGCFGGETKLGLYRIASEKEVKNSPKITYHDVSSDFKGNPVGFFLKEGEYLIAVK